MTSRKPGSLRQIALLFLKLGTAALVDALTVLVAAASALLLIRFRVNFAWLVLAGAVIGLLRFVV